MADHSRAATPPAPPTLTATSRRGTPDRAPARRGRALRRVKPPSPRSAARARPAVRAISGQDSLPDLPSRHFAGLGDEWTFPGERPALTVLVVVRSRSEGGGTTSRASAWTAPDAVAFSGAKAGSPAPPDWELIDRGWQRAFGAVVRGEPTSPSPISKSEGRADV